MARVDSALRADLSWARNRSRVSGPYSRSFTRPSDFNSDGPCRELDVSAIAVQFDVPLDRFLESLVFLEHFSV